MKKKLLLGLGLIGMLLTACGDKPDKSEVINQSNETPVSESVSFNNSNEIVTSSFSSESTSSSSSNSTGEQKVTIEIINQSTSYCTITCSPTTGYPGDDATLTVEMKSSYTFKSIEAFNTRGADIDLLADGNSYTFEIPYDGKVYVTVRAEKIKNYQKLFVNDPKNILTSFPAYVAMGSVTPIMDTVTDDSGTYYNIETNSKVRFYFPNKDNYSTLGLTFKTVDYTPNNSNYVDLDFSGKTGDLVVDVYGKKAGNDLHAENSEHLSITFMNKSKTEEIETVVTDTEYYVIITSEDKNIYVLDTLTLMYTTKGSSSVTSFELSEYVTETSTGYELLRKSSYSATNDEGYIWTVTEDNLNKYIDEPFCGNYVAFSTFTYTYTDYHDAYLDLFTIAGSGKATFKSREMKIRDFEIDDNNIYYLKNKDQYYTEVMYFQNDTLIAGYNTANSFGTPFYTSATDSLSDDLYAFKMLPNTRVSDYTLEAEAFTIDGITQVISVINYNNSFYKAMFTRRDKERHVKEFYTNVTIDVVYGNSFKDEQSVYAIKQGDVVLATIGFTGNGGNKNRCYVPAAGGLFTNGDKQLVVCESVSIYDGAMYVSEIDSTQSHVTLRNTSKTIVVELNKNSRTFTIESETTNTLAAGPFAGKIFRTDPYYLYRGLHLNESYLDDNLYCYYIKFDATQPKMNCIADVNPTATCEVPVKYFGKNVNVDYYYDSTTGKITAMILGFNNEYVIAEFTYADDKITFLGDTLSGGKGKIQNSEVVMNEVTK